MERILDDTIESSWQIQDSCEKTEVTNSVYSVA